MPAKIKIFHGDNVVESRRALSEEIAQAKAQGVEIVNLNGAKTDLTEVRSALESSSLFGQDKLVVFENFFSQPQSSFKKKALTYFKEGQFENNLIFWEEKKLSCVPLEVPSRLFRLDPVLFRFLESLKEGGAEESLALLAALKKKEAPEMIFYMIVRQLRLLISAKDSGEAGLSGMAPWQKKKFSSQAKSFSLEKLINLYRELLEIDYQQKTSQDPFPLSSRLDLLVSEI